QVVRSHESKPIQFLIDRLQVLNVLHELTIQLLYLFLRRDALAYFPFQFLICDKQTFLLLLEPLVLLIKINEYSYFGAKDSGINGFVNVIHCTGLISLKEFFISKVVGSNEND